MSRLTFDKVGVRYFIHNNASEWIGVIERIRNGQWMHYSLVIPLELIKECEESDCGLSFSPGCQDEIREFCKKLNSDALHAVSEPGVKE